MDHGVFSLGAPHSKYPLQSVSGDNVCCGAGEGTRQNLSLKIQLQNMHFVILTTFIRTKYQIKKTNGNIVNLRKTHAVQGSL